MVDQPGPSASRSYKIRGHTRQRRTTKPYARPGEVKKKGLLDKVKDYLSPSWLFSYFQKDEDEDCSDSEEEMNEEDPILNDKRSSPEYNVTRIEKSTEISPIIEDNTSIFVTEDRTRNIVSPPSQLLEEDSGVSDKDDFRSTVFTENNNKGERWIHSGMSSRLSGELEDDEDDIDVYPTSKHITETEQPQHSVLSYSSQQLKRRPLPSILHSRTPTSTLFQHRGAPIIRPQGNSLLSLMSSTTKATSFSSQPSNVVSSRTNTRTTATSSSTAISSDPWKRSQPVALISSAPGFSVSTFVTPVPRVFTKRKTESPFYPGTVTYGGALSQSGYSSGKRQRRNSPGSEIYQPVRKQQIRAKPLPNAVHGGATSQTAQRILEALESVSSPLKDVRRIPSPLPSLMASPLSFSPTKLRSKPPRSKLGPRVSSLQAKLLGGPPVEVLSAPQNANVSSINVRESYHPKTMSTPLPSSDLPLSKQKADSSPTLFSGLRDTVLKTSLPTFFKPKALPTSLSPVEKTTKASGKMRSASRGVSHYSAKNSEDDYYEIVNPLPEIVHAVPLPVNPSKNMSSLFQSSQVDHTKSSLKKPENNKKPLENHPAIMEKFVSESSKNGFIFSKPKQRIVSVKEVLSMADDEVSFSFSEPLSVKTMAKKASKSDSAKDLSKKSPLTSEKCLNGLKTTCPSIEVDSGSNLSETRTSLANMFGLAVGEWDCKACMIRNKASVAKCVACSSRRPSKKKSEETEKTLKEEPSKASSSDLAKQFAPVEGSWDCDMCMVNNKASALTCVACSTAKPGAMESASQDQRSLGVDLKTKFAAPANTWDCEACMIRNTIEHDKCAACETKRPAYENDLKSKFAAPLGSWSCDICMISNKPSDVKCAACETAKPGGESNTGFSQTVFNLVSSSSNENPKSGSSSSGFTFGNNAVTTSSVPSFTFGKSTSEETKPSFTFGNSAATTETSKSEFKFDVNSTSEQKAAPKFTFGLPQNDNQGTGFVFGAKASDSKASPVTTDQDKPVSNIDSVNKTAGSGPLNIAQAAAAGLLKVPGLNDITPSSKQVATSQPAFQLQTSNSLPSFTNGSTSFGASPKNLPDSSTAAAAPLLKENTPAVATTNSESVKIIPFTFGGVAPPPSVSSSTTTAPGQTPLGNTVSNQIATLPVSKPQASFNFSAQPSSEKNNGKPSFSFGASKTASSSGAAFKFGASSEVQSNVVTKASSLFPTTTSASTATAGAFSFTGGSKVEAKPKIQQFNFGSMNGPSSSTATTQSQNTANALFSFSAGQPSNPDSENQNSLGGEEMDADSNNNNDQSSFAPTAAATAAAGFNFTAQAPGTAGNATGGFNFGSGGPTNIPPSFQFGAPSSTTNNSNNTPSGGFSFPPRAPVPVGSSPFVFGGQSTGAPGVPANVPSASSGGFNFGAPSSFTFGQPAAGAAQSTAFNIGAAQNTPASARLIKRGVRRSRRQ